MKKNLSSKIAALLESTAQKTVGTTSIFIYNQPKVPQCLLKNDK